MTKKLALWFLLGLGLAGCSALRQNVVVSEPTEGPRARIRVVIPDEGQYRGVRAYPNSTCANRDTVPGNGTVVNVQIAIGFEKTLNGKKLGIPETAYSMDKRFVNAEFYAAANQPIAFTNFRVTDKLAGNGYMTVLNNGCSNQVYFVPEENVDYELVFGSGSNCKLLANRLNAITSNAARLIEPVAMESAATCKQGKINKPAGPN